MNQKRYSYFYHSTPQYGLSLVELLVAITLGLFLIWGVTQSFLTSKQTYRLQQGLARIQENGRMAQEFLSYDIRNAGDYGCGSSDDAMRGGTSPDLPDVRNFATCSTTGTVGINMIDTASSTALDDEFEYAVYGFDNVAASTTTLDAVSPAGVAVHAVLSQAPKENTDVLMVHVAVDLGTLTASVPNPYLSPTDFGDPSSLNLNTSNQLVNSLARIDRIAVSDCATMKIFAVDNMASADTLLGLSTDNYCKHSVFQMGAAVRKLNTVYYFVSSNSRGGYSLYRQVTGSPDATAAVAEELLEGVEDLQLEFGIDNATGADTTTNDGIVDLYKPANDTSGAMPTTVAAWTSAWNGWDYVDETDPTPDHKEYTLVRSVRYSLLIRAEENGLLSDKQQISFNGNTLIGGAATAAAGDNRLREVFTGTVGIRSRVK